MCLVRDCKLYDVVPDVVTILGQQREEKNHAGLGGTVKVMPRVVRARSATTIGKCPSPDARCIASLQGKSPSSDSAVIGKSNTIGVL